MHTLEKELEEYLHFHNIGMIIEIGEGIKKRIQVVQEEASLIRDGNMSDFIEAKGRERLLINALHRVEEYKARCLELIG